MLGPGLLPAFTSCLCLSNLLQNSLRSQICCRFLRSHLLLIPLTSARIRIYHEGSSKIRFSLFDQTRTMLCTPPSHQFPRGFEQLPFTSIFSIPRCVSYERNDSHVVSSSKSRDEATTASRSNSNSHTTLAELHTHTLEVKKSKFIAVAAPVDNEKSALSFLSQVLTSTQIFLSCRVNDLYVCVLGFSPLNCSIEQLWLLIGISWML